MERIRRALQFLALACLIAMRPPDPRFALPEDAVAFPNANAILSDSIESTPTISTARSLVSRSARQARQKAPVESELRRPTRLHSQRSVDPGREALSLSRPAVPLEVSSIQPDPLVQAMMGQVTVTSTLQYLETLSGESAAVIGGQTYTITTRYTYSGEPIGKAAQYVAEHLTSDGLDVEYHQWAGDSYPNVIGEIEGAISPEKIFIFSAHLDSLSENPLSRAPGADDNGSGVTATLTAADVLSKYQWACTLRFAFWTGEEQGLLGSQAYAVRSATDGEEILGVLNMDMVGYNSDATPALDLHASSTSPNSLSLANLFAEVVGIYNLDLQTEILIDNNLGRRSDNQSFWLQGYPAILAIEDLEDFNPYYHSTSDRPHQLDNAFFTEFIRAGIGAFAHMSDCLLPTGFGLLRGQVIGSPGDLPVNSATINAQGASDLVYTTTTDVSGNFTRTLPTGTYSVTAEATGYLPSTGVKVSIASDLTTFQHFALQPKTLIFFPLTIQDN